MVKRVCRRDGADLLINLKSIGFISSDSFKKVVLSKKAKLSYELKGPHSEYYDSMSPLIEHLMSWSFSTPKSIAVQVEKILSQDSPPLRLRVTIDAKIFAWLRKILPAKLFHHLMFLFLPGTGRWGQTVIQRRKTARP